MKIGTSIVMLNHDTRLYPHHIDDSKLYDFSAPAAEITRHPSDPKVWGLRNLTQEKWVSTGPDGTVKDVPPGRSVTLASGTKVNFGKNQAEIRY
ncbi:MAG: hypothetical protein HY815_28310 [Candidatus Riflebacteria bacterium]|nr:hypothetical protein [Candidatus Riflebacteria bacterium]